MTPVEERIDHAQAKEIAEEGVEWCRDFRDGQFTPAHTEDGWSVEMHGLVDSHAKLSAFVLALLTEHSAREESLQGWQARDAGDGLSTIERGIEIDDNLERMVGPIPYERAEEIEVWLEALSVKETPCQ